MADKKLILKVDLSCALCCEKMKKIFCKYQDKWNIKKITWDDKKDMIILVGPFDPKELKKKLCCKACRTIREFIIPEPPKPEPPKPEPPKPEPPKPEPPKPEPPKPEPPKPEPPKPVPPCPPTIWVSGQICNYGHCHEKQRPCCCDCSNSHRPCGGGDSNWPGRGCGDWCYGGSGCGQGYPCPMPPIYGRPTCQLFCEDDPSGSCNLM